MCIEENELSKSKHVELCLIREHSRRAWPFLYEYLKWHELSMRMRESIREKKDGYIFILTRKTLLFFLFKKWIFHSFVLLKFSLKNKNIVRVFFITEKMTFTVVFLFLGDIPAGRSSLEMPVSHISNTLAWVWLGLDRFIRHIFPKIWFGWRTCAGKSKMSLYIVMGTPQWLITVLHKWP